MTSRERWAFGIFAVAIALAMDLSLRNGFVYDDVPIILNNLKVTDSAHWHEIFGSTYWPGSLWRPITVAGYAVQWAAGNGAPWLFHLVELGLYLLLAWCSFRLLREIGAPVVPAMVAMVVFVVHPVHVEVVANVVGQAELWTATALVIATWLYLRTRRLGMTLPRLFALLAAIAVATMAKEQGFVAPLMLIGAEWLLVKDPDGRWPSRLRLLVPATAFTLLMFLIRSTVTGTLKGEYTVVALANLGFRDRLVTFIGVVPEYARLLIWPLHLQAEYSPPNLLVAGPITLRHLLGVVLIGLMLWCFLRYRRRAPLIAFGLWWAAVAIGPVSSIVSAAGIIMAERVFFQPSLGFAFALAGALATFETGWRPTLRPAVQWLVAAWIVGATVRSAIRVPVWHDQDRFFTAMPLDGPNDYRAALVAGMYWHSINRMDRAEQQLREAIRLWPHDARSNETLGQLLRAAGRCREAVPVLVAGLVVDSERTSVRAKLVECQLALGDTTAAMGSAEAGIAAGDSSFVLVKRRIQSRMNPKN
jgi:hypothetical protein